MKYLQAALFALRLALTYVKLPLKKGPPVDPL